MIKSRHVRIKPKTRGRRVGDKRLLTPNQKREIRQTIIDKNPEQLKLKCCMWTRKAIIEENVIKSN
jgi:hypothetical protein